MVEESCIMELCEEVRQTVLAFDEALGSPPFDEPVPEAISLLEKLLKLLQRLEKEQSIQPLGEVEEFSYTFPILCAAVPEGSRKSVSISLYRLLIECLVYATPILKYPLDAIVRSSMEILSFDDALLFRFLRATKSLTSDILMKFLNVTVVPTPGSKKKGNKKGPANSASVISYAVKDHPNRDVLMEIFSTAALEPPLVEIIWSCISDSSKFNFLVNDDRELSAAVISIYGSRLLDHLAPESLLSTLCATNWPFFVSLLDKHCSFDFLKKENIVKTLESTSMPLLSELCVLVLENRKAKSTRGVLLFLLLLYQCLALSSLESLDTTLLCALFARVCEMCEDCIAAPVAKGQTGDDDGLHWLLALHILVQFSWPIRSSFPNAEDMPQLITSVKKLRSKLISFLKSQPCHRSPSTSKGGKKNITTNNSKKKPGKNIVAAPASNSANVIILLSESMLQQYIDVLMFLDDILPEPQLMGDTLLVLDGKVLQLSKELNQPISPPTWMCFLKYINMFGSRASSVRPELKNTLTTTISRAVKATACVEWLLPFVTPGASLITGWLQEWPLTLLVDVAVALCKRNCFTGGCPASRVAVMLLCCLETHVCDELWTTLHEADALNGLRDLLASGAANEGDGADHPDSRHDLTALSVFLTAINRFLQESSERAANEHRHELEARSEQLIEKIMLDTATAEQSEQEAKMFKEREAAYNAKQKEIQAVLAKEREAQTRRKEKADRQREKQKQLSLEMATKLKEENALRREEQRKARLQQYKEASYRAFRASTFLHSLGISTSVVMKILNEVVQRKPDITPDDLLEYIVTGSSSVPRDMTEDEEEEEEEMEQHDDEGAKKPSRKGFWDEVMEGSSLPVQAAKPRQDGTRSFHLRIQVFMDLFCYEGGDVFGNLPEPLPRISLKVAKKLMDPLKVADSGFRTIDEAFLTISRKKLVRLKNDTAEITVLGFRYHFPFHNPEGMLEVLIRLQKEKALALLAARRLAVTASGEAVGEGESDSSELEYDDDEWSEEEQEEGQEEEDEQTTAECS